MPETNEVVVDLSKGGGTVFLMQFAINLKLVVTFRREVDGHIVTLEHTGAGGAFVDFPQDTGRMRIAAVGDGNAATFEPVTQATNDWILIQDGYMVGEIIGRSA
jgi:hypothetical protein